MAASNEIAFPTLNAGQIAQLRAYGEVRTTKPSDVLFQEGDPDYSFIVILKGEVAVVARPEETSQPIETSLPGVFAVGDVRSGSVKRVASAVGEGSIVVRFIYEVLAEGTSAPS